MPRAAFTTLGCRVNQYETQRILDSFEGAGFTIVPFNERADVYVINTCSVTGQAEAKSRQTVRRAARTNPSAKVVVTGCAAQMTLNKDREFDAAHLLIPNPEKLQTLDRFLEAFPAFKERAGKNGAARKSAPVRLHVRANVKIQDGCDVYCGFCSIPYTRPGMVSRNWKEVVQEVRNLCRRGCKEIILTGVLIGSYGRDTGSGGPDFEELVEILSETREVVRIRISSIEMTQVSNRLIKILNRAGSKVVPHLHIPLQSGSAKVLKEMRRPYTQADYLELCARLQNEIPDIAITADIMVGYPTETDDDFEETLNVCESVRFARAHVFRFSPRPGTPADEWGDAVSPQVKQVRSKQVIETTNRTRLEYARRFIGREMQVVVERRSGSSGMLRGYTQNYIELEFPGPQSLVGEVATVRIVSADGKGVLGEIVSAVLGPRSVRHLPVLNR